MSRDVLPIGLCGRIHLGQEMHMHTWEVPEVHQIWTVNQASQNDWPKETWRKYHIKITQTDTRAQLRDSPSESAHASSTLTVLFFLLRNILLASLLSVFVEILFCKHKGPGPL